MMSPPGVEAFMGVHVTAAMCPQFPHRLDVMTDSVKKFHTSHIEVR